MSILFKKIRWQNFLSTGNQWTEVNLNKSNTTLIIGENGAGKSTLLDAICFALYGKAYRNVNKPLLVNSITNKNCLVEIEFNINGKSYLVRRGLKPGIFEIYCDDKLLDQDSKVKEYQDYLEKNILKLNHKSFTQIVIIGAANYTPFMQLKPNERRIIIEDLLDIEIFTKMHTLLKQKIAENKDNINETKYQIDLLEEKIKLVKKHLKELVSINQNNSENKKNKIKQIEQNINELTNTINAKQKDLEELNDTILDHKSIKNKLKKLKEYKFQLQHKFEHLNNEIKFFNDNSECPTCKQDLDSLFVTKHIDKQSFKKNELSDALEKLNEQYDNLNNRMEEINSIITKISNLNNEVFQLNTEIKLCNNNINELNKEQENQNINIKSKEYNKQLEEYNKTLKYNENKLETLTNEKTYYDVSSTLLKDTGIKSKIIKQYIPIINKLMNKYLAAMEFFVQFELDENFNEKIKSRFRDEFTYDSFSEGEKMRINLSLLFTWRSIAKIRNSSTTNLLIMDEVFDSSLDTTGTDEFLKLINQLTNDTNTFVISHKGDQLLDKFDETLKFEKVKNFSYIAA